MARIYAKVFTLFFGALGIGGILLGDANHVTSGLRGGNVNSVDLELTWARDAVYIVLAFVCLGVGFVAKPRTGSRTVAILGVILVAGAAGGWVYGPHIAGGSCMASGILCGDIGTPIVFSKTITIIDVAAGLLAVLAALGPQGNEPKKPDPRGMLI